MKERFDLLSQVDEYIGRYYSTSWVRKNILNQTEEEIKEMDIQMEQEKSEQEPEMDQFGQEEMQGQEQQGMEQY